MRVAPRDAPVAEVTREDQERMCEYAVLIFRQPQLRAEVAGLKVRAARQRALGRTWREGRVFGAQMAHGAGGG